MTKPQKKTLHKGAYPSPDKVDHLDLAIVVQTQSSAERGEVEAMCVPHVCEGGVHTSVGGETEQTVNEVIQGRGVLQPVTVGAQSRVLNTYVYMVVYVCTKALAI